MLQRNATDHPLDVPAASTTLQPGDEIDWPEPIVGCEPVPEPSPTRKRAAAAADTAKEA